MISLALVTVIWFSLFGLTARGARRSSSDFLYSSPYSTSGGEGYYDYSDQGYYEGYNYAQGRSLDLGQEGGGKLGIVARMGRKLVNRWGP